MTLPIERMIDAAVRCTVCGKPPGCACWARCWCGASYRRGKTCEVDHATHLAETIHCVCSIRFAKARACADARKNKTPCRCACHHADVRAARARLEAEG